MEEIIITDNVKAIVDAKSIINNIEKINKNSDEIEEKINQLLEALKNKNSHINIANEKGNEKLLWIKKGLSNDDLFSLIKDENKQNNQRAELTFDLLRKEFENTKVISDQISSLAFLSGLSFEKIMESTSDLEKISNQLFNSENNVGSTKHNLNLLAKSHFDKILDEKKRYDRIEFNFGVLNSNTKELDIKLNKFIQEQSAINMKIENIEEMFSNIGLSEKDSSVNSNLVEHINKQARQNKVLKILIIFLALNFITILSLFYFNSQ